MKGCNRFMWAGILLLGQILIGQEFQFRNFNTEQGLPVAGVLDMAQDAAGRLWLATYGGGLAVFDGLHTRVFGVNEGLPSGVVNTVLVDRQGIVWAGTSKGLCSYDGQHITTYSIKRSPALDWH